MKANYANAPEDPLSRFSFEQLTFNINNSIELSYAYKLEALCMLITNSKEFIGKSGYYVLGSFKGLLKHPVTLSEVNNGCNLIINILPYIHDDRLLKKLVFTVETYAPIYYMNDLIKALGSINLVNLTDDQFIINRMNIYIEQDILKIINVMDQIKDKMLKHSDHGVELIHIKALSMLVFSTLLLDQHNSKKLGYIARKSPYFT
jgi:hypothetical protein